jgi:polysaccharide biosynthesis/export protein
MRKLRLFALLLMLPVVSFAQAVPAASSQAGAGNPQNTSPSQSSQPPLETLRPNYILQPNDQIFVHVLEADEINDKLFRVDDDGFINFPTIGRIKAAGLLVEQLEAEMVKRLREYIKNPVVSISVTQFRNEPVFFVGLFKSPGIYPLQGGRTLLEMLTLAGGVQPNANRRIRITRRSEYGSIPLPSAVEDPVKHTSTVEISLPSLTQDVNPAEDIILKPYDVISVDRSEEIYMAGALGRTGPLAMEERSTISMAQALTMAGWTTPDANISKVKVLRPILNSTRRAEIDVNVKRLLEGKDNDFPLLPNDLVYISRSKRHTVYTTLGALVLQSGPYIIFTLVR